MWLERSLFFDRFLGWWTKLPFFLHDTIAGNPIRRDHAVIAPTWVWNSIVDSNGIANKLRVVQGFYRDIGTRRGWHNVTRRDQNLFRSRGLALFTVEFVFKSSSLLHIHKLILLILHKLLPSNIFGGCEFESLRISEHFLSISEHVWDCLCINMYQVLQKRGKVGKSGEKWGKVGKNGERTTISSQKCTPWKLM